MTAELTGIPDSELSIRCEIALSATGVVTVVRHRGCAVDEVRELCMLVGSGHVDVTDRAAP